LAHNYGILCLFNPLFRPIEPVKVINNSTDIDNEQFLCSNRATTFISTLVVIFVHFVAKELNIEYLWLSLAQRRRLRRVSLRPF
jgi:hypothetical protein